jgi:hypothetical protein
MISRKLFFLFHSPMYRKSNYRPDRDMLMAGARSSIHFTTSSLCGLAITTPGAPRTEGSIDTSQTFLAGIKGKESKNCEIPLI